MDAHTLNAWTRFALQKGGIGTCTALIDNPATELEDLMFMTGEKIIVLRRLDENGNDESSSGSSGSTNRRSMPDADTWFLVSVSADGGQTASRLTPNPLHLQGYCEGVVGRFKGAHVQFHSKLKKPVLMRRSGVGSIRESTTQPMSKTEAATMHASQVPLGIPVTAVNSDGEEEEGATDGYTVTSGRSTNGSRRTSGVNSKDTMAAKISPPAMPMKQRSNRLGVTTPPLSDENHARRQREPSEHSDSDSDDSDTRLPWARSSGSSAKSSRAASTDYTHETNATQAGGSSMLHKLRDAGPASHLPPSPISSAESPIHARNHPSHARTESRGKEGTTAETAYNYPIPRIRAPGLGHTSNQSSVATTNTSTSESEEDAHRRDQTFSIYDVYGRDSVAFPNFDFRNLNNKTGRIGSSKSTDSLSVSSHPNSPLMQSLGVRGLAASSGEDKDSTPMSSSKQIPVALRTPSGRRPTAAPAPPSMASNLRRKVEANAAASVPSHSPLPSSFPSPIERRDSSGSNSQFGSFDPKRRPSMGNRAPVHAAARFTPRPTMPIVTASQSSPNDSDMPVTPTAGLPAPSPLSARPPLGANLHARRMQDSSAGAVSLNETPIGLHVDVQPPGTDMYTDKGGNSLRSPNPVLASSEGAAGPRSPLPIRSSSDRTSSTRERVGSGQLKKNPSNPQPGLHGGLSALAAPSPAYASSNGGGLSTPTGSSRSPSPLSAPSPTTSRPGLSPGLSASPGGPSPSHSATSPIGQHPPQNLPGPRVLSNAGSFQGFRGVNPATVSFDALGFVVGSGFPIPVPPEDPEEMEKWRQVLAENDLLGAKKSRKIKKMVHTGIPHSMRAKVWPYLANSYVRRRAGLFEELCKTSQSVKGKKGKETLYEAIDKDLHRAFPDHRLFMGDTSTGRADLEAILKAYVHYNPIVGYTQGMSLVAGFLLIQMPAEDAFWMLCALLRDVHMEGYYANEMKQLHVDGIVFGQLLQTMDPELATRLTEMAIEPINFAPNWFLPLFTRIVPWQTLLRIWDVFLYEGPTWILRTALGIIRIIRDPLMDRRVCPEGGEGLRLLLHPPQQLLTPENIIPCALSVKLKDGEMRKLSRQASKLVRTSFNQSRGRSNAANKDGASVSRSSSAPAAKRG